MRSPKNLPIYLVYVVACLLAISFIVSQIGVLAPWSHPYRVTATFADASSILSGNEVLMNGVKVGRVEAVSADHSLAKVTMIIDSAHGTPVYSDAVAQVRKKNLLGETYVDLHRGSNRQPLPSGGNIPVEHTVPISEIDQVLAIFDPDTRQRVKLLINSLGTATSGRGEDLNSQADSVNRLTTSLTGPADLLRVRRQQLMDVVMELQKFYDTLARQREQVRQEFGTWNDVMGQLAGQDQQLAGTLQQADTLLTSLDSLTTGEAGNIQATLQNLGPALQSATAFLSQSNQVFASVAPYRKQIHDVFPHLASSFADTDPNTGQHFWSIFSVNCPSGCGTSTADYGTSGAPGGAQVVSSPWNAMAGGAP